MPEYISRDAVNTAIDNTCAECRDACIEFDGILADCNQCMINGLKAYIHVIPAADVVARDCFDRILAENDTMREQLASIGKKPGDGMEDVRRVRFGTWEDKPGETYCIVCPFCREEVHRSFYNFCPNCGADMGGENNV